MASSALCYDSVNPAVLARVPIGATRLLDVGCGGGALGGAIKQRQNCAVIGVTHNAEEAVRAARLLDDIIIADLNNFSLDQAEAFDGIICSHVLEHLIDPGKLLIQLRPRLSPDGVLIVALPNILFWRQRLQFLKGKFRYTTGGLMDQTHLRFFDWTTARELVEGAGYRVVEQIAEGGFPQPFVRDVFPTFSKSIDAAACSRRPGFFGWQFVLVATSRS